MNSPRPVPKPRILVVDDESDNLDLLYRTFRREFEVLRALSGQEALEVLAKHGEVAVIISDQRMPEMKGTEFLRKTVPQFPDTVRMILTGFTDVEDLVEAINAGQVHRYITKPWEPEEMRQMVRRAVETYELLKQRTQALDRAQTMVELLQTIVRTVMTTSSAADALTTMALAMAKAFAAGGCCLDLADSEVRSQVGGMCLGWPNAEAVAAAATAQSLQASAAGGWVVQPVLYRQQLLGTVALCWPEAHSLTAEEQRHLELAAEHLAVALRSL